MPTSDDSIYNDERVLLLQPTQNKRICKLPVEIVMLTVLFSSSFSDGVTYNLLLYRACTIDLNYNTTKCELLHSLNKSGEAKQLETEVQAETTLLVMALSMVNSIMPAVTSVFVGSWSDKHGRKSLLIWPLNGMLITSILVVIYSSQSHLSSWWFILCALPYGLLGGSSIIGLGANLLITDVTCEDNRSFRLAVLQGCGFMGVLIGTVASNYIYEAIGFMFVFTITAVIYLFILIYTLFGVEESLSNTTKGSITGLFDYSLLKDMVTTCFRKRFPIISIILFLLILSYGITMFCVYGVDGIDYLFTRQKFQWLLKEYNVFSAVNTIIMVFGIFLGMAFFQSVCKMSDGVLLILAYLSSISEAIVRTLSKKSWHMYLAGTMSMLGGLSPPLIRSQITKLVPAQEVAKLYSLISCVEAASPIFSPLLFNIVYFNTLFKFPGAIYVVSGSLFTLCLSFVTTAEVLFYKLTRVGELELLIN